MTIAVIFFAPAKAIDTLVRVSLARPNLVWLLRFRLSYGSASVFMLCCSEHVVYHPVDGLLMPFQRLDAMTMVELIARGCCGAYSGLVFAQGLLGLGLLGLGDRVGSSTR
jgi:hypothetical protein